MKIKFSDMSSMIAEEVISLIAPKIRKIVREEVNRGVKSLLREQKKIEQLNLSNKTKNDFQDLSESKENIAKRAHDKARSILEKKFASDDPFADLSMSAEDPMENKRIEEQVKLKKPMTKVSDVSSRNVVAPDEMDFSEMVDRII